MQYFPIILQKREEILHDYMLVINYIVILAHIGHRSPILHTSFMDMRPFFLSFFFLERTKTRTVFT